MRNPQTLWGNMYFPAETGQTGPRGPVREAPADPTETMYNWGKRLPDRGRRRGEESPWEPFS